MTYETIKHIYYYILKGKANIEWYGEDKYKLVKYIDGVKNWEVEYKGIEKHGNAAYFYNGGNWTVKYINDILY